jgi:hypothetical protein
MSAVFTLRNLLIATAIALAAALGIETDWGNALNASPPAQPSVAGKHDSARVLPDFRMSSENGTYAQISERPLLNPSRRPAPTQVVQSAPEPPKPQVRRGLYQLIGVIDLGNVKVAQVRELASNRTKSVREGDSLQEMTVKKVDATQITLAFQGETDVIELAKYTASGRVPQPAPPSQPIQPSAQLTPPPVASAQPPAQPSPMPPAGAMAATGQPVPPPLLQPMPQGAPAGAAQPQREVISVVEMLERRRLARQQAGGQ